MISRKILHEIDHTIKDTWVKNIKEDYYKNFMINEDCLKISMYYHLRRKLASILKENNLRIYTEFFLSGLKYRADMIIVEINPDYEENTLCASVKVENIVALIEFKFTSGADKATQQWVRQDIKKLREYKRYGMEQCLFYFAVIYETSCDWLYWMDKRSTKNWAKGCVAELDAGFIDGEMQFEVKSYH